METDLVPRAGFRLETVQISNFQRKLTPKGIVHNVKSLHYMLSSRRRADQIIRDFQPDVIIGTGGYAQLSHAAAGCKERDPHGTP